MKLTYTTGRVAAAVSTAFLLSAGANFLVDSRRFARKFENWKTAKTADVEVDLSKTNHITASFVQTRSSAHSETVALRLPAESLRIISPTQVLSQLQAHLEVVDTVSNTVIESVGPTAWESEVVDGAIPIFFVDPTLSKGRYELRVTVVEGASVLHGIPQRLEGRYLLYGLEQMPATIAGAIGLGSLAVGGITGLLALRLMTRGSRQPEPPSPSQTGSVA